MICPKCGNTSQLESAEYCSLCYEPFRRKERTPAPSLVFPRTTATWDHWKMKGCLVLAKDSILYFIQSCRDTEKGGNTSDKIQRELSTHLGLPGMGLAMAVNAFAPGSEVTRPEGMAVERVNLEKEPFLSQPGLKQQALGSENFLSVPKKEITNVKWDVLGRLIVDTKFQRVSFGSIGAAHLVSGYLKSNQYAWDQKNAVAPIGEMGKKPLIYMKGIVIAVLALLLIYIYGWHGLISLFRQLKAGPLITVTFER